MPLAEDYTPLWIAFGCFGAAGILGTIEIIRRARRGKLFEAEPPSHTSRLIGFTDLPGKCALCHTPPANDPDYTGKCEDCDALFYEGVQVWPVYENDDEPDAIEWPAEEVIAAFEAVDPELADHYRQQV